MGRRLLRRDADRLVKMRFTQLTLGFNGPGWDVARVLRGSPGGIPATG